MYCNVIPPHYVVQVQGGVGFINHDGSDRLTNHDKTELNMASGKFLFKQTLKKNLRVNFNGRLVNF